MNRYNKAFQGGAGAALGILISWITIEAGLVDEVPMAVEGALAFVCAALLPAVGPANAP